MSPRELRMGARELFDIEDFFPESQAAFYDFMSESFILPAVGLEDPGDIYLRVISAEYGYDVEVIRAEDGTATERWTYEIATISNNGLRIMSKRRPLHIYNRDV